MQILSIDSSVAEPYRDGSLMLGYFETHHFDYEIREYVVTGHAWKEFYWNHYTGRYTLWCGNSHTSSTDDDVGKPLFWIPKPSISIPYVRTFGGIYE